jgi:hypothetical protein
MTNTEHGVEGVRVEGLIGPRHEIPRKLFRCSFGYCVHFVLHCKSAVEGGKGRNLKGERKELCIISVWLGVFCSSV